MRYNPIEIKKSQCLYKFVLFVITVLFLLPLFTPVAEADVPYSCDWEYVSEDKGIKKLVINFDYTINAAGSINIRSTGTEEKTVVLEKDTYYTMSFNDKTLEINFETTGEIPTLAANYPDIRNWEVSIPMGTLKFNNYIQLDDFTIPFNIRDVEPGFKSSFIDASSKEINDNILQWNNPRKIRVWVPNIYISKIETIHRYGGIVEGSPHLSNIDVTAEPAVKKMKLSIADPKDIGAVDREISLDPVNNVFSAGYAGLHAGLDGVAEDGDEIKIDVYDEYGRFLEEKNFKMMVTDSKNDFKTDNYIDDIESGVFNQEYSLYELMADPALMESIISQIPVSQLDKLGIYCPGKTNVARVADLNALAKALADNNKSLISLSQSMVIGMDEISIGRDLTLEGKDNTLTMNDGAGKLILGNANDENISLRDITIEGDLDIDVGSAGTVKLENVTVNGTTTIISGGTNSIYLDGFATTEFLLNNTADVRVIASGNTNISSTKIDTKSNVTLVLDQKEDTPSFGSITGKCSTLTWGAGADSGFDMQATQPNIAITGSLSINVGEDNLVDLSNVVASDGVESSGGTIIQTLNLDKNEISEAVANDGSISDRLVVTVNNAIFSDNIDKTFVSIDPCLDGLDISVERNSANQITITFIGNASSHQAKDSIENARVKIKANGFNPLYVEVASAEFSINFVDNLMPSNQDIVFAVNQTAIGGGLVSIVSSGVESNEIWFAPLGTQEFNAGAVMTKAASGIATTITAPANEGYYKLYIKEAGGNISSPSKATLTVVIAPEAKEFSSINNGTDLAPELIITIAENAPTGNYTLYQVSGGDAISSQEHTTGSASTWTLSENYGEIDDTKEMIYTYTPTGGSEGAEIDDGIMPKSPNGGNTIALGTIEAEGSSTVGSFTFANAASAGDDTLDIDRAEWTVDGTITTTGFATNIDTQAFKAGAIGASGFDGGAQKVADNHGAAIINATVRFTSGNGNTSALTTITVDATGNN